MARVLRHIDVLSVANLSLLVLYPVAWFAPLLRAGVLPLFGLKEISVLSGLAAIEMSMKEYEEEEKERKRHAN